MHMHQDPLLVYIWYSTRGLRKALVPSSKKPVPDPVLIQICDTARRFWVILSILNKRNHTEFIVYDKFSIFSRTTVACLHYAVKSLHWRHNEGDRVSNHQPHDCLLNRLFKRRSKPSKFRVRGIHRWSVFPAQRASNAENVSIWWRHHVLDIIDAFSEDITTVLQVWHNEFSYLHNIPDRQNDMFDNDFVAAKLAEKNALESMANHSADADETGNSDTPFSMEELNKVCFKMKNGKSVGPDLLPNEVLKTEPISFVLLKFMNTCFRLSIVPSSWQKAIIAPIPKSSTKDPYVPLNYRGISLLSCFYKTYSALINNRLTKHCELNDLIVDEQNGFRPERSCSDHIYCLCSILKNRISDNLSTYCAFIDMRKAFDWVNRDLLLYKLLSQFGVYGKLYDAIKLIYGNSSACVRANKNYTEMFDITSGVKQGDVLSPPLFSMFLNDLAIGIKDLGYGVNLGNSFCCTLMILS